MSKFNLDDLITYLEEQNKLLISLESSDENFGRVSQNQQIIAYILEKQIKEIKNAKSI